MSSSSPQTKRRIISIHDSVLKIKPITKNTELFLREYECLSAIVRIVGVVSSRGTKHIRRLRNQFVLLNQSGILKLLGRRLRNTSHDRLLPRINRIVTHNVATTQEIQLDLVTGLAVIESDLNSTRARTSPWKVVYFYGAGDDVFAAW
jgi:hypothetical protein